MFQNIRTIIEEQKVRVEAFEHQAITLTESFKEQYLEVMEQRTSEIYFYENFSVVETSNGLKIYIPNQWFYLAYLGAPLIKELLKYKQFISENYDFTSASEFETFVRDAKSGNLNEAIFVAICEDLSDVEGQYVRDLLTDYESWGGGKSLDRGDFYVSPVLDLLNLVHVSSGYVAEISRQLAEHFDLTEEDTFFSIHHVAELTGEVVEAVEDYEAMFTQWLLQKIPESSQKSNLKYLRTLNNFVKDVNKQLDDSEYVPFDIWQDPIQFANEYTTDEITEIAKELEPNASYVPRQGSGSALRVIYNRYREWVVELEREQADDEGYDERLLTEHRQYIYFGAPGTGKSYQLNKDSALFGKNVTRTTFHPNMTYGSFVGVYKPFPIQVPLRNQDGSIVKENNQIIYEEQITYNYVPGPLIKQLVQAFLHPNKPHLLIIEELNRADVAATFGDVFQLLDRNSNYVSEYPIDINEDLQNYFATVYDSLHNEAAEHMKRQLANGLIFPSNFYIWSTMNSADQGVMPMDTAFKRRWEQKYFGIDEAWLHNKEKFAEYKQIKYKERLENGQVESKTIAWNVLRRYINDRLSLHRNIPEDKLLGPYFISEHILKSSDELVTESFISKVLMYLFDDVVKIDPGYLFKNVERMRYSEVVHTFATKGLELFGMTAEEVQEYTADEISRNDE